MNKPLRAHVIDPDSESILEADAYPGASAATGAYTDAKVNARAILAPLRPALNFNGLHNGIGIVGTSNRSHLAATDPAYHSKQSALVVDSGIEEVGCAQEKTAL